MGLFAEIDNDKRVLRVIVADNAAWCQQRLGGTWVETAPTSVTQQGAGPGLHDGEDVAPMRFVPPWVQPQGAHDAYETGAWVWHAGLVWENLTPANVHAPGVSGWRDPLNEWPAWVQPAGGHDAYPLGAKVTHNGRRWISSVAANVWAPGVHGWTQQAAEGGSAAPPTTAAPSWKSWDGQTGSLYQVGAKVMHNGKEWTATTGNNHWEPGVYGWA